jgi:preprotein translocase subunit SecG
MSDYEKKESWFKGRISNILFGIFCIAVALIIKSGDGDFYDRWGAGVPRLTWILWFIFGAGILLIGIMKKEQKTESFIHTLICSSCFELHNPSNIENNKCPKCDGNVEDVKEFYKKNPDFMNRKKT